MSKIFYIRYETQMPGWDEFHYVQFHYDYIFGEDEDSAVAEFHRKEKYSVVIDIKEVKELPKIEDGD